jgi:hypothetical protein
MSTGTTTPPAAARPGRSTNTQRPVVVGDLLLVAIDQGGTVRPLLVTTVAAETPNTEQAVNGTIFCEPEDHTTPLFRGWSRGASRVSGHPDRLLALGYGEALLPGTGLGDWRRP